MIMHDDFGALFPRISQKRVTLDVVAMVVGLQEVTKVKQDLDQACKEKKELNTAKVRLTGMLKTGQDALKVEQQEVSKLRAQLMEKSKVNASTTYRCQH